VEREHHIISSRCFFLVHFLMDELDNKNLLCICCFLSASSYQTALNWPLVLLPLNLRVSEWMIYSILIRFLYVIPVHAFNILFLQLTHTSYVLFDTMCHSNSLKNVIDICCSEQESVTSHSHQFSTLDGNINFCKLQNIFIWFQNDSAFWIKSLSWW